MCYGTRKSEAIDMADPKIVVKYNNVEVPGDFTTLTIGADSSYTINDKVFVTPVIYKYDTTKSTYKLLASSNYTYTTTSSSTTFTFTSGVNTGDVLIIFSGTGSVISTTPFVYGATGETFSRTGALTLTATGADFIDIVVEAQTKASGLADASWVSFSLDQSQWSSQVNISTLSEDSSVTVYFKVTVPSGSQKSIGTSYNVAVSVMGVATA